LSQVADDLGNSQLTVPVSINIEPDLISRDGCAASIINTWEQRGLPPRQLGIEITETQDLFSLAYNPLALLKDAGHRIALDDFGTGYASLSRILGFPFDEIKLDRAFLEPIDLLNHGLPLLTVAIDVSDLLGIDLVVEGIEDPRMVPVLKSLGVRLAQGFALSHPLPLAELLKLSDPLPLPSSQPHGAIMAAAQIFRWERAIASLAASETSLATTELICPIARDLAEPDLVALHQAQHRLTEHILTTNDPDARHELGRLGRELRGRVSTRHSDH
jgi:hypothetical protein